MFWMLSSWGVLPALAEPPPGQPGGAAGWVFERGSGIPLAGIAVSGDQRSAIGPDGHFQLVLPMGSHAVTIESDGPHLGATIQVEVTDAGTQEAVVWLDRVWWHNGWQPADEPRRHTFRRTVSSEELDVLPGTLGDPLRAVQALPGMARNAAWEPTLGARGSETANTQVYLDDVPLPMLAHLQVGRSVVNPLLVRNLELVPGALPVRYGDGVQAAVQLHTADVSPEPGLHGRVRMDLLDLAVATEGRISDAVTWQLGARTAWAPLLGNLGTVGYHIVRELQDQPSGFPVGGTADWLARVVWDTPTHRVTAGFFGAYDLARYVEPDEARAEPFDPYTPAERGFWRVHARWDQHNVRARRTTWVAFGGDQDLWTLGTVQLPYDGVRTGRVRGWTLDARREDVLPVAGHELTVGGSGRFRLVRIADAVSADPSQELRTGWVSMGAYGALQIRPNRNTHLTPGLRLQVLGFGPTLALEPEPRLNAALGLSDAWTVVAGVGRHTQLPPPEMLVDGPLDATVRPVRSWQASVGIEGRWASGLGVDLSGWASSTAHQVGRAREPTLVGDSSLLTSQLAPPFDAIVDTAWFGPPTRFDSRAARAVGGQATVRLQPEGRWFGWISATVGRTERRVTDRPWLPDDSDALVRLSAVVAHHLPRHWSLSARYTGDTGTPYTPEVGVLSFDGDAATYDGLPQPNQVSRFAPYHRIDVRVSKTWVNLRSRTSLFLDVYNATNQRNAWVPEYTSDYTSPVVRTFVPILPTLGMEVAF